MIYHFPRKAINSELGDKEGSGYCEHSDKNFSLKNEKLDHQNPVKISVKGIENLLWIILKSFENTEVFFKIPGSADDFFTL